MMKTRLGHCAVFFASLFCPFELSPLRAGSGSPLDGHPGIEFLGEIPGQISTQELSVEEIVNRSAEALGGSGNLESLRTLRFWYAYRYQEQGRRVEWEIIRPNLLRKDEPGVLRLLFDGERAGFLEGPPREDGSLMGPHLVPDNEIRHFQMDMALYFPAFFDFPAEYAGDTTIEGAPAHLIRVTLPSEEPC